MIEKNVLNLLDLGEGIEELDIYKDDTTFIKFCNFMKTLLSSNKFPSGLYLLLQSLFNIQICCLSASDIEYTNDDIIIYIFNYFDKVFQPQDIIKNYNHFIIAIVIISVILVIIIILLLIIFRYVKEEKGSKKIKSIITILNLILLIITNYLIGPITILCLYSILCKGDHKFLEEKCFSGTKHIIIFCISVINFIFYLCVNILFSIFYTEIGNINYFGAKTQIKTNYELYSGLLKIGIFIINYSFHDFLKQTRIVLIIYNIIVSIIIFIFCMYVHKQVFFYDKRMNYLIEIINVMTLWFCLVITIKIIFNINSISLFIIIGWIIFIYGMYNLIRNERENLVLKHNIFESKSVKQVEMFISIILSLSENEEIRYKTIILGFEHRFKDYISSFSDIKDKIDKINNNDYLKNLYKNKNKVNTFYIVYVIYDYLIEKNKLNNNFIIAHFCYFLINNFKNMVLAMHYCSKMKCTTYLEKYHKFLLAENIKDYLNDLSEHSDENISIRHVHFSSVILSHLFKNLIKMKIYDASNYQIEYIDYFKNFTINMKSSLGFLEVGRKIIKLRKEIKLLYDKNNILDPFCEEIWGDYKLYLETIIQDYLLCKEEEKNYRQSTNTYLTNKNSFYFKIFDNSISSVLLTESMNKNSKILYMSQNFKIIFQLSFKETGTLMVNDLIPNGINNFHNELANESIRYSNFYQVFSNQKNSFLKTNDSNIFNIKIFVKELPNLLYGLLFIVHIEKIKSNDFFILLDDKLRISGYSDNKVPTCTIDEMNIENYGMSKSIINLPINAIIPEVSLLIKNKNNNQESKLIYKSVLQEGYLFPNMSKEIYDKIELIIKKDEGKIVDEKINRRRSTHKFSSSIFNEIDAKNNTLSSINNSLTKMNKIDKIDENENYKKYMMYSEEIKKRCNKFYRILFKITKRSFLNDRYRYYYVTVNNYIYDISEEIKILKNNDFNLLSANTIENETQNKKVIEKKENNKISDNFIISRKKSNQELSHEILSNNQNKKKSKISIKKFDKKDENSYERDGDDTNNNINNVNGEIVSTKIKNINNFNNYKNPAHTIKNKILDDELNTKYSIIMFYSIIFVGSLSVIFVITDTIIKKNRFVEVTNYLKKNSYFNNTKICVYELYLTLSNIMFLKENFIKETSCKTVNCSEFFRQNLLENINSINETKQENKFFYSDYILELNKFITLNINNYYSNSLQNFNTTHIQILDLLIINGLKLEENINNFIYKEDSIFVSTIKNILNYINLYEELTFIGFNTEQAIKNINQNFSTTTFPLILTCFFIFLLIILLFYIILYTNSLEIFFVNKIINLNSESFEDYLKVLSNLKNKFKNENENDEEGEKLKEKNKFEEGEHKESEEDGGNEKNNDKNSDEKNEPSKSLNKEKNTKINNKRAKMSKKNKERKIKMLEQKKYKIKRMEKLIFFANILNAIKILICLVLLLSYYIFQTLNKNKSKTDYISFNNVLESIESVFVDSFNNYYLLKKEILLFSNLLYEKEKAKNYLKINPNSYYIINGKNYTSIEDINKIPNYKMNTINKAEFVSPSFANLIMNILSQDDDVNSSNTVEAKLYKLFSNDACEILYENEEDYKKCSEYWFGVITYGLQQTITEYGNKFSTMIDSYNDLNAGKKDLNNFLSDQDWLEFDNLMIKYMFLSFNKTKELLDLLRIERTKKSLKNYSIIFYCYVCAYLLVFVILIYFVYSVSDLFNSFFNFTAIIPVKILTEDKEINSEIEKIVNNVILL